MRTVGIGHDRDVVGSILFVDRHLPLFDHCLERTIKGLSLSRLRLWVRSLNFAHAQIIPVAHDAIRDGQSKWMTACNPSL